MKTLALAVLLALLASPSFARSKGGYRAPRKSYAPKTTRPVRVKGYIKKSGTYVAPSVKTSPNHTKRDNYSTKGNANPYTGKEGTIDPNKK